MSRSGLPTGTMTRRQLASFGAVRGTSIRRSCRPRSAPGACLASGSSTSGFVVLGKCSLDSFSLFPLAAKPLEFFSADPVSEPGPASLFATTGPGGAFVFDAAALTAASGARSGSEERTREAAVTAPVPACGRLARVPLHIPSTTKPDVVVPVARLVPEAARGPQVRRIVVPRTDPKVRSHTAVNDTPPELAFDEAWWLSALTFAPRRGSLADFASYQASAAGKNDRAVPNGRASRVRAGSAGGPAARARMWLPPPRHKSTRVYCRRRLAASRREPSPTVNAGRLMPW